MPLSKSIAESMATELPALKAAKAGGYFYLIVGKKLPWILAARSPSAAAEKYKAAKKLILASDRSAFLPGSAVYQGPILFKSNRIVLVLDEKSPDQGGEALEKWLQTAALRLAQEIPRDVPAATGKEIKQISVFLARTLVVGATESERMAALDSAEGETYADTGVEVELPGFDETELADVERIKQPISKQLKAVPTEDVAKAASAHDKALLDGMVLAYKNAIKEVEDTLGKTWATEKPEELVKLAPHTAKSPSSWLVDLVSNHIGTCNGIFRSLVGFTLVDSTAPQELSVAINADLTALRELRDAVEATIVRCEHCCEAVDLTTDLHPHAENAACPLWYHQACLDSLPPERKLVSLIERADGPGKPTKCPLCRVDIDPRVYARYLTAKVTNALYEVTQRVPDDEIYQGRIPLASFPCPKCKTPWGWTGGCDIMTCPGRLCGDYNIYTGKPHTGGARGHSGYFREGMGKISKSVTDGSLERELRGNESGAAKGEQVIAFYLRLGLNERQLAALQLQQTVADLQDAALEGNTKGVRTILGEVCYSDAFKDLHAGLLAYYVAKAESVANPKTSCCYLTTACTAARGLPDDCEELTTLRRFRDGWLMAQPGGPALVETYYALAPRILATIEGRDDRHAALQAIYVTVRRCVDRIHAGDNQGALAEYQALSLSLAAEAGLSTG